MNTAILDIETLGLLRDSIERYGSEKYGFERRAGRLAGEGFGRDAWADYAAMGWLAMALPADAGGFDSAPAAVGVLMEYAGERLALEPLFASVVLCGRALGLAAGHAAALRASALLAAGERLFAFAHAEDASPGNAGEVRTSWRDGRLSGRKVVVLHGDAADELVVTARDAATGSLCLLLVPVGQPGVERTPYRLVDRRGAASFHFREVPATPFATAAEAEAILARCLDEARLALCSEAHGAVRALNRMTLSYLKERRQFGRPLGTNQVLQHRMVESYMLEQEIAAVVAAARRQLEAGARERERSIVAAAAHAMAAARHVSHDAVQMHGGIGITDELAVSHYFARIMVVNRLLGDRQEHLDRFAQLQGPP